MEDILFCSSMTRLESTERGTYEHLSHKHDTEDLLGY
jgi:hypothetical protein